MKVALVNYSDISGGAARAAYRIHHALMSCGLDSNMYVNRARAGDWSVHGPKGNLAKVNGMVRPHLGGVVNKLMVSGNPILHSPAILPSKLYHKINSTNLDIVNLHWINGETLSVKEIGNIDNPIVWTLHDMWAFCGAEHYTNDHRWKEGYTSSNRPEYESGFDLNQWVWKRKLRHWKTPIQIVTPSNWLAECVKQSKLMHNWPVSVIHYAIDTDKWRPMDKSIARQLLNLPLSVPLILFGATGGTSRPRKGFDLLRDTLRYLQGKVNDLELVVFGQLAPEIPENLEYPVHYVGYVHDDLSLQILYNTANLLVIPSRQDNLPNTGVESLACGTPVVAFDTCGLPDIVSHKHNGYLAKSFDVQDMAAGIVWVLEDSDRNRKLSINSRNYAINRFSYPVVSKQYHDVYKTTVAHKQTKTLSKK